MQKKRKKVNNEIQLETDVTELISFEEKSQGYYDYNATNALPNRKCQIPAVRIKSNWSLLNQLFSKKNATKIPYR